MFYIIINSIIIIIIITIIAIRCNQQDHESLKSKFSNKGQISRINYKLSIRARSSLGFSISSDDPFTGYGQHSGSKACKNEQVILIKCLLIKGQTILTLTKRVSNKILLSFHPNEFSAQSHHLDGLYRQILMLILILSSHI